MGAIFFPLGETWAFIMSAFVGLGLGLDRVMRPAAKAELGHYVLAHPAHEHIGRLAVALCTGFGQIFGTSHWSWKCIRRSFLFTVGTLILFLCLEWISYPSFQDKAKQILWAASPDASASRLVLLALLITCFFVDYLNLYKSRKIIFWLSRASDSSTAPTILVAIADFIIYYVTFYAFLLISMMIVVPSFRSMAVWFEKFLRSGLPVFCHPAGLFFYSGLLPSVWIWLLLITIVFTGVLARTNSGISFAKKVLAVEEYPGASIGFVAGLICCGLYTLGDLLSHLTSWNPATTCS